MTIVVDGSQHRNTIYAGAESLQGSYRARLHDSHVLVFGTYLGDGGYSELLYLNHFTLQLASPHRTDSYGLHDALDRLSALPFHIDLHSD